MGKFKIIDILSILSTLYFLIGFIVGRFTFGVAGLNVRPGHILIGIVLLGVPFIFRDLLSWGKSLLKSYRLESLLFFLFLSNLLIWSIINPTLRGFSFLFWMCLTFLLFGISLKNKYFNLKLWFVAIQSIHALFCITQTIVYLCNGTIFTNGNIFLNFYRNSGLSAEPSYLVYNTALIPLVALLLYRKKEMTFRVFSFCWGVSVFAVLLSYSRLSQLVLAIIFLIMSTHFCFFEKKIKKLLILSGILLLGLMLSLYFVPSFYLPSGLSWIPNGISEGSQQERMETFKRGMVYLFQHLHTPSGIGNAKKVLVDFYQEKVVTFGLGNEGVHCLYQEIAIEQGVWSLFFVATFLWGIYLKIRKDWVAVTMFLMITFINPLFINNVCLPEFWLILLILLKNRSEPSPSYY